MRSTFSHSSGRGSGRMPDQAQSAAPTQDIADARDNPLLRRYDGSFIVDYAQRAFEEFELPTAELKQVADKKDAMNNDVFVPTAPTDRA